jgi:hypothetical protein
VAIPRLGSKETFLVIAHSFFLVLRTVLSVAVARLDGRIVRDLVSADGKGFMRGLGLWFLLAIPSTYTNSMVSVVVFHRCIVLKSYINLPDSALAGEIVPPVTDPRYAICPRSLPLCFPLPQILPLRIRRHRSIYYERC